MNLPKPWSTLSLFSGHLTLILCIAGIWVSYGWLSIWASFRWRLLEGWGSPGSYYRTNWTYSSTYRSRWQILTRVLQQERQVCSSRSSYIHFIVLFTVFFSWSNHNALYTRPIIQPCSSSHYGSMDLWCRVLSESKPDGLDMPSWYYMRSRFIHLQPHITTNEASVGGVITVSSWSPLQF